MKGWVPARVIFEVLWCWHWRPLEGGWADGPQHTILCDRLEGWRLR
jgi:hypothetical protein